jgi:hypothetical protein
VPKPAPKPAPAAPRPIFPPAPTAPALPGDARRQHVHKESVRNTGMYSARTGQARLGYRGSAVFTARVVVGMNSFARSASNGWIAS